MNNKNFKNTIWFILIAIAVFTPISYFIYTVYNKEKRKSAAEIIRYSAFGIDMPPNFTIHGIDVSKHQEYIHWPSVKAMEIKNIKISFAFIKATEGLTDTDKYFKKNWKTLKANNITRGAYLFFLATKSGKDQADNFIKTVNLQKGDLPPVVDIEELYGIEPATMRLRVMECLETLQKHYGVKPILYSYVNFYDNYLGTDFNDYPLWIAHYFEKEKPRIDRDWSFWQHSEKGRVNGITTSVDFNVFKGDSTNFKSLLISE